MLESGFEPAVVRREGRIWWSSIALNRAEACLASGSSRVGGLTPTPSAISASRSTRRRASAMVRPRRRVALHNQAGLTWLDDQVPLSPRFERAGYPPKLLPIRPNIRATSSTSFETISWPR